MDVSLINTKFSSLCFVKEDFIRKDFSLDKFISECRKCVSLENMLEDFGLYHKILRSSMVELINKDYADFVNLSSNLVGLDRSLKCLTSPLHNLKDEITTVKRSLHGTTKIVEDTVSKRNSIHQTKNMTHRVTCILEGLKKINVQKNLHSSTKQEFNKVLPLETLERIAMEYNLVQFYMFEISDFSIIKRKKEEVNQVGSFLQKHLECLFLQSLSNNDISSLQKVLQIFSVLAKERQIEICFGQKIVNPYMTKVVTEKMVAEKGLFKVYDDVLQFIPKYCSILRDIKTTNGYDFLVNAVWPQIVLRLESIETVYIFDKGNPDIFHQNYSASILFLESFEQHCAVQASVKRLRSHPAYIRFMKKWNLEIYFQIRFKDIAGTFEYSLKHSSIRPPSAKDVNTLYSLDMSFTLWFCINRCFSYNVFLVPLSSNFWKLSLRLISRYTNWIKSTFFGELEKSNNKYFDEKNKEKLDVTSINHKGLVSKSRSSHQETEAYECPGTVLQCATLIQDVELLISEIKEYFPKNVFPLFDKSAVYLKEAFNESCTTLQDILPLTESFMVKILINQCSRDLKLINDIPRLYRKTNRETPSKPSNYVTSLLKPLEDFQSKTEKSLPKDWQVHCLQKSISGIVERCFGITKEVLVSIKKMEDSLKILKKARDKPAGQTASGIMTDDDKMRRQLAIDATSLENRITEFGIRTEDIKSYAELKTLVTTAEQNYGALK